MGLFDKRTPEEKAAGEAAKRLANRKCPFIMTEWINNEYPGYARDSAYARCEGPNCRWWSPSGNECYVILACKKVLGEE